MNEAHLALLLGGLILAPFAGALVFIIFRGARGLLRGHGRPDVLPGR